MKNKGKDYELLTKRIFEEIQTYQNQGINTMDIQHDVIIKGKTTSHQIDVLWRFEVAGIEYLTIVQAKDWNYTVSQDALLTFKAVLDDIPGQPRGIFVTKTGYQSGAKQVSENNGIMLYELREPTDADWDGRIKSIQIHLRVISPEYSNFSVKCDKEWMNNECNKSNLSNDVQYQITELAGNIWVCNHELEKLQTIANIIEKDTATCHEDEHRIIELIDKYLKTDLEKLPFIKLKSIEYDLHFSEHDETINIDGGNIVGFILKETLGGKIVEFDTYGRLRGIHK